MSTLRDASKKVWFSKDSLEEINAGSLQRIADAVEVMSKDYRALIKDRDRFKLQRDCYKELSDRSDRSNAALRGQITKLKKQIHRLRGEEEK